MFARLREEAEREFIRLVRRAKLDFDGFVAELRKRIVHLAIEDERRVGVEFFLELEEMRLGTGPRARLIHRKHKHVATRIVGECVEHSRVCDAVGSQTFGNHW